MQTIEIQELEALRNLKLNIKRTVSYNEGFRRSNAKGRSAEFSGYREYIPGDDMRYVDWNAYARLDKLYIKEYMEEREGRVNIYLDTSRSMQFALKKSLRTGGGLSFIISDFMDEDFLSQEEEILRLMNYRKMEVRLLQILSKEEMEVERTGSFRFIDSEDETKDVKLTLDRSVIKEYKAALDKYINDISGFSD